MTPGEQYEGRGHYAGLRCAVLAVREPCEAHNGYASVRFDKPANVSVQSQRGFIQSLPEGHPARECSEKTLAELIAVHVEDREFAWFTEWQKRGYLVKV